MLSDSARPVIEATLGVVGANIGEIATRFYRHLFENHPELLDGTFNRGNQASGEQRQSLAGSVAIYATWLVEHPGQSPVSLLTRIAHKHASLGIAPESYQIVHDNLFWAIVDVLGDAVTPEVAAAWDEVYWLMATDLINIERGLYSARGITPENIWRPWEVLEKNQLTDDVVEFVVGRIDNRIVKTSLPGQYVTVQVDLPDGTRQPRQFSLTRADDGRTRSFAVKRIRAGATASGEAGTDAAPAGEVSNLLHDTVQVGDVVVTSLPFGAIVLDDGGNPVVFCTAGIGATIAAGMLSHLVRAESSLNVTVLHADSSQSSFPLRAQIEQDVATLSNASLHVFYDDDPTSTGAATVHAGRMDLSAVPLPTGAAYYLCGPVPFMQSVRSQLIDAGVAPANIQYEVFGPDLWQADTE